MSRDQRDIATMKVLLQARVSDLVHELCPDGELRSGYWFARNPARVDKNVGSFFVWVSVPGTQPGAWVDKATDQKGDILDLICHCRALTRGQALAWARKWLNYETMTPAAVQQVQRQQSAAQVQAARDARVTLAQNQARAFGAYIGSKKIKFRGSLADTYLQARGIDVGLLPRVPGALGFMAEGRHTETGTLWPVMVAGLGDDRGIKAIHRTFLTADGSDKAPVKPPRKIWPSFKGLAIRLWRGETEMAPGEAASHGLIDTLCLCEGVEDGLSVALARPDLRVWAAGSLDNLGAVRLPECCEAVIVCADNDWGKPEAEKALAKALQLLAQQGRPVRVARAPDGHKDFNDVLRAGGRPADVAAALAGAA
jgi:Toprim domain